MSRSGTSIPRGLSALAIVMIVGLGLALLLNGKGNGGQTTTRRAPKPTPAFPAGDAPERTTTDLETAVEKADCDFAYLQSEGDGEVLRPVQYKSDPPHSGLHFPEPAPDGAYREVLAAEAVVHSLRHGRVAAGSRPPFPQRPSGHSRRFTTRTRSISFWSRGPT